MLLFTLRPTVVSGGGGADNAAFSFTSTENAGTPSWQQKFLGGLGGVLDSGTNNVDFIGSGLDTGFAHCGAGAIYPRFITAHANIRATALDFDAAFHKATTPANSAAFGVGYDTGGTIGEVYLSYHIVWTCNTSVNLASLQQKQVRFTTINSVTDDQDGNNGPLAMTSNWKDPNTGYLAVTTTVGSETTLWFDSHGDNSDYPNFNTGIRYFVEQWIKPSSGASVADGAFKIKVTRCDTGAVVTNHSFTGITNYTNAQRIRWIVFQFYSGNATPEASPSGTANGTTTFEVPGDGRASLEDGFIQVGTDAQRVLIATNAATWAASTDFRAQPCTMNGTNRSIAHLNRNNPAFTHIFEKDETGTLVSTNGTPIT